MSKGAARVKRSDMTTDEGMPAPTITSNDSYAYFLPFGLQWGEIPLPTQTGS